MRNYEISRDESNMITFLRAICMVMVIYLHQYSEKNVFTSGVIFFGRPILEIVEYIVSRIITFSAVPLFYLISGVLLFSKEFTWSSNIRKKLNTLIIPYFLWVSLYMFVYFIGQSNPLTSAFFMNAGRIVRNMNLVDFIGAYTGVCGNGLFVNALWFLKDLIILNMLAPVIKKVIDKIPSLFFFVLFILWSFGGTEATFILNSQSICFFSWGYYIVKYKKRMTQLDTIPICELTVIYIMLICFEYYLFLTNNILRVPAHSFTVFMGIALLIRISSIWCKRYNAKGKKIISIIAKYSFFIYASHDLFQMILKKLYEKIIVHTLLFQTTEYIIVPILTIFLCINVARIIELFVPRVFSLVSGARISK